MHLNIKHLGSWLLVSTMLSCGATSVQSSKARKAKKPRNVILMIGDGMGITQITAGLYSNNNQLNLERCPTVGLIKTYSADDLITDSAAGATAFSTGKKTYNGAIGVDADTVPQPTLMEMAKAKGMSTGIVVTCEMTHATPASFYAHQDSRNNYEAIAEDFLDSDMDLVIGGGEDHFHKRSDGKDLFPRLRKNGYLVRNLDFPFADLELPPTKKLAYFTARYKPRRNTKGRVYLPEATEFAIPFLDERSEKGFFMVVEGSQIDWGGHANNAQYIITEMLDFDASIGKVLDWAEKDGQTLVVITADHETGGFGINRGSELGNLQTGFTTGGHTADLIPVFAFGPGAERFSGIYENTDIYNRLYDLMGLNSKGAMNQ